MIKTSPLPVGFTPGEGFDPDDELNAPTLRDSASVIIDHGTDWDHAEISILRNRRPVVTRKYMYSPTQPNVPQISRSSLHRLYNLLYGRHWNIQTRKVKDFFHA